MVAEKKCTVVIGCDSNGLTYKNEIKADLENDSQVSKVIDVGVNGDDVTAYPHIAVTAATTISSGKADRNFNLRYRTGRGYCSQQSTGDTSSHGT